MVTGEKCSSRIAAELQHNVHYNLGIVLMNRGQLVESAQCFRQALKLNPGNVEAHIHLGNTLMHQGQSAEAIACYRQALCINPQHATPPITIWAPPFLNQKEAHPGNSVLPRLPAVQPARLCPCAFESRKCPHGTGSSLPRAAECFRQELRLNPNQTEANNNLRQRSCRSGAAWPTGPIVVLRKQLLLLIQETRWHYGTVRCSACGKEISKEAGRISNSIR